MDDAVPAGMHISTLSWEPSRRRTRRIFFMPREENFREKAALLLKRWNLHDWKGSRGGAQRSFNARIFLATMLECPLEDGERSPIEAQRALKAAAPGDGNTNSTVTQTEACDGRHRSANSSRWVYSCVDLGSPLLLDTGKPFRLGNFAEAAGIEKFREVSQAARGLTWRTGANWPSGASRVAPEAVDEIFNCARINC